MTEAKLTKSTCKFTVDGKIVKFEIISNLPEKKYEVLNVLNAWLKVTVLYTDKDFCDYVNSRTHITECFALTIEQYENIRAKV